MTLKAGQNQFGQPILVTGAHRTGTTWVGKMLAASPEVAYISEPFNLWHRVGVMRAPVRHWYTYICSENEVDYLSALRETITFRYQTWEEIKSLASGKDLLRMGRDWSIFLKGRLLRQRPLLKDPFAVFSISWFAERLGSAVVVLVRHPGAFVSSLARLEWNFNFGDLLAQPPLLRDWLEPFRPEMEAMLDKPEDVIGQSSLLWRMIYHVVAQLKLRQPHIIVLRHEDLSLDPVKGFKHLYKELGLDFDRQIQRLVLKSSSGGNPKELPRRTVHAVRLDSRGSLNNWKRRLNQADIERVRLLTADVAGEYYTEEDWV